MHATRNARRRLPLLMVAALIAVLAGVAARPAVSAAASLPISSAQRQSLPIESIPFSHGRDVESSTCGKCHTDIYEVWKTSVHANALTDPVFQAGLAEALVIGGPDVAKTCLTCHSPASVALQPALTLTGEPPAREGIGCRFCHAVRSVDLDRFPAYEVEPELVMFSRSEGVESPVHDIERSSLLGSPLYCAGCHEYTSPAGAPILSTFSEYNDSGVRDLAVCQDCHMPYVLGQVVNSAVRPSDEFNFVESHAIPGGRSLWHVRRAVRLELVSLEVRDGGAEVTVAVSNSGGGHWVPTGMPSKRIVLEVATIWATGRRSERFVFERHIVDAAGVRLHSVADMMLNGARVTNDTRLRPGQRRQFSYTLPAPMNSPIRLLVRLYYESTESPDDPSNRQDIHVIERTLTEPF